MHDTSQVSHRLARRRDLSIASFVCTPGGPA
jgi:hypothetical protein